MDNSFIYKWTDHLTGMFYIGIHKGTINDGYICSSKIMLPIYRERPETFTREILSYHQDYTLAREEEIRLLEEVDASRNPLYYNQSNGGPKEFYSLGPKTEEHKKKLSDSTKKTMTTERRCELSKQKKGISNIALIGIPRSEETKEKIRQSNLGKKWTQEQKDLMSVRVSGNNNPMYGKTRNHSEETRKKMSKSQKTIVRKKDPITKRYCKCLKY